MWRNIALAIVSSPYLIASFIVDVVLLIGVIPMIILNGWSLLIAKLQKNDTWIDRHEFYESLYSLFLFTKQYFQEIWRK